MQHQNQQNNLATMLPLFLVIFIDSMGLGILFPILNGIIMMPDSKFIAHNILMSTRQEYFGMIIGIFMLCWFFGAAILGDLSDIIGRKKSLIICLIGSFLSYLLSAISVKIDSFALLIIGRIVAGFTAGSQPIAQAAIVDISNESNLPRNMGFILLCVSLGFVFGPIMAGFLSDSSLISWFNYTTPLYFAAIISLFNSVLLWIKFHETYQITESIKVNIHKAIAIFISAFTHKKVGKLSFIYFIMQFGWGFFFNYILLYLDAKFKLSNSGGSIFMLSMGIGFAIGCGYLANKLSSIFKLKNVVASGFIISAITILILNFNINITFSWLLLIIICATLAYGYSSILVLFSNIVSAKEQGWVMGITGSIFALSFGVTAIIGPFIAQFGKYYPIVLGGCAVLISGILIIFYKPQKK